LRGDVFGAKFRNSFSSALSTNVAKTKIKIQLSLFIYINPIQPKVLRVKFSLRRNWKDFFLKIRNFKLFKMAKL